MDTLDEDEEEEEEVTFLLRLRPTPSPPAGRRRKSSTGSVRPVSGGGWDVVIERPTCTPPPPRKTSLTSSRPSSGLNWDANRSAGGTPPPPAIIPSAPPPAEVLSLKSGHPWAYPIPQHAWGSPYVSQFPWQQNFQPQVSDYQTSSGTPMTPKVGYQQQTAPDQNSYQAATDRFPEPTTGISSFLQDRPQKQVSSDYSRRAKLANHQKSYSFDCGDQHNLSSLTSLSSSYGSLFNNPLQNEITNSSNGYSDFNDEVPQEVSSYLQDNNFINNFRRYTQKSESFLARARSLDQLQRCGTTEAAQKGTSNKSEVTVQNLPPRPPRTPRQQTRQQQTASPAPDSNSWPPSNSDVEERLRRLEADKDSLQLQVTVLTEQIEAQTDKIADLEKLLEEKKKQLAHTEDLLQREMLSRSSLETQKLELLSAMSELKLQQAALERDNLELRERLGEERRRNKPPMMPRTTLMTTSTPLGAQSTAPLLGGLSPSPSPVSSLSEGSPRRLGNHPNSVEDFKDIPAPRTPPANYRRKVEHYGSLPRQRVTTNGTAVSPLDSNSVNNSPSIAVPNTKKGVAFGKGLSSFLPFQHPQHQVSKCRVAGPDKSYSSPNLAETERIVIEDNMVDSSTVPAAPDEVDGSTGSYSLSPQPSPSLHVNKSKGIKKIFGRMKRSGSGNLDDLPGEGEFRRGGVRATAGPRLGWTNQPVIKTKPDAPFNEWDSEAICRWLQELGLECYAADAKRWVKTGAQLLQATSHEIEKELGIKNPVHRKKLQLALLSLQESVTSLDPHIIPAGELDTAWVLRWLDDVGLPQHKETFLAARVDGRVLHRLTMDDLATTLHVSSLLHVASLRRGIQVLREHSFEPNCLKRRSLPDDPVQPTASDVALWTNHRVMEWLRVVDLAEYAPNLRGSGVHGGLMVHEPRFTAELLASLLSIPPSKTLLRRHLNTHFKELLGRECIQEKREAEATLGYVPLTATTKVKIAKKSQFTLKRKKSKSELDFGDLVCPLDPSKSGETSQPPGDGMTRTTSAQAQKALGAFHEAESSSSADALSCDSPLSERTSNV